MLERQCALQKQFPHIACNEVGLQVGFHVLNAIFYCKMIVLNFFLLYTRQAYQRIRNTFLIEICH